MRPPRRRLAPGTGTTMPPPRDRRGAAPGDQGGTAGKPPSPPPPPPPLPPPGARTAAGGPGSRQSAAHSLLQCPLPTGSSPPALKDSRWAAAEQRHPGMQHGGRGTDEATRPGARPEEVREQTAERRPPRPPPRGAPRTGPQRYGALAAPPPPRQADQPTAGEAAPGARGCPATPAEHIYPGGVRRRRRGTGPGATGRPPGQGGGEPRRDPPSPLLPTPPSGLQATGAPALQPPRCRGDPPPPPRRGRSARGREQPSPHTALPHASHGLLLRGPRQAGEPAPAHKDDTRTTPGAGTQTRTRAVWGTRPPRPEHRQ